LNVWLKKSQSVAAIGAIYLSRKRIDEL